MDLKSALATGKRVSLAVYSDEYMSKETIEDYLVDGVLSVDYILSTEWTVEPVSTVKLSETDFKAVWDEVAEEFTSVKPFETSVLAKKLLAKFVSAYKVL